MLKELETLTLVNQQSGKLAFKLYAVTGLSPFDHLQQNSYYSLIWLTEGNGKLKSGFAEFDFGPGSLFAFAPYQPFMLSTKNAKGIAIHFHPDFFCIHKHHAEVACNGVLFNNIYEPPFVQVNETAAQTFNMVINQMQTEMQNPAMAKYELLISYLKIFLITASRLKAAQQPALADATGDAKQPFILQNLKDAIEKNYKQKHTASDYAEALNISARALAKATKAYLNKTITDLIAERIIIEAKRELYLTNKTVKEIAYELGYQDEYYFSRFFKANAEVSPQTYRETVGFGRAEA